MQAWQATVQDDRGNAIPNPVVSVYEADGTTLAAVYNAAGVAIANPVAGNIDGFVQFYARPGVYKVNSDGGESWDVTFDGVYGDYPSVLAARKDGLDKVSAVVSGKLQEWVYDPSATALGGGVDGR